MTLTVYTIEMVYAHMRSVREQADRSRVRTSDVAARQESGTRKRRALFDTAEKR